MRAWVFFALVLPFNAAARDWTVLIYMEANNNLFPYALSDLAEMETPGASSSARINVVVEVHGPPDEGGRRLRMLPARRASRAPKRLEELASPVLGRPPEAEGLAGAARLRDFLLWGAKSFPAKNYFVIVWGHGQGWKAYPPAPAGAPGPTRSRGPPLSYLTAPPDPNFGGIAYDGASGTWLDIPALREALRALRREIGKPVDVYASDACLMQTIEVAYELAGQTRFVAGSAQVQDFLGLPYARILRGLNAATGPGAAGQLAREIPRASLEALRRRPEKLLSLSASTVDESLLATELVPALTRLGRSLAAFLEEDPSRALDLQLLMQSVSALPGSAQDAGVFLEFLEIWQKQERKPARPSESPPESPAETALRQAVGEARAALDHAVLAFAQGDRGAFRAQFRALSLWLPGSAAEYQMRREEFRRSRFYRETGWSAWLDLLFAP